MKKLLVGSIMLVLLTVGFVVWQIVRLETPQPVSRPSTEVKEPVHPEPDFVEPILIDDLHRIANEERAKAGVKPLSLDARLNKSAQMKADEIQATGVFEHVGSTGKNGPSYIEDVGVKCKTYSENLAGVVSAAEAVDDWMVSRTGHREALLNSRFDLVGYGTSMGPGYYYVTQHFCDLP